jgi:hypothetical protein
LCAVLRGFSWTLSGKARKTMVWPCRFEVAVEVGEPASGQPTVAVRFAAEHGNAPDPFHDPVIRPTDHTVGVGYTLFAAPRAALGIAHADVHHSGPVDVTRRVPELTIRRPALPGWSGCVAAVSGFGFSLAADRPKVGRHLREMVFRVADGPYDRDGGTKTVTAAAGVRGAVAVAPATHESHLRLSLLHYRAGKQLRETLEQRRRFSATALKTPDRKDILLDPMLLG